MPETHSTLDQNLLTKLDQLAQQHDALAAQLEDPAVLGDHRKVRDISIRKAAIEPVVSTYRTLRNLEAEAGDLKDAIANKASDPELAEMAQAELPSVEARIEQLAQDTLASLVTAHDNAVGSVILELRAGAGGDEAGLWTGDLLEMYERYAGEKGWRVEQMELSADDGLGGIRHAVINITGEGVWSHLAHEAGVHSVKRVPATEAQGRIHTSTATVAVLAEPEEVDVQIDWANDVTEHITTAQGPGGQNVNKVATACHLIHTPTGIEVRMQESKSQQQNREKARRLLAARVYEIEQAKAQAQRDAERKGQIGTGQRSEKIRVYRYQEGLVVDQRVGEKYQLRDILAGHMDPMIHALMQQEIEKRLAAL